MATRGTGKDVSSKQVSAKGAEVEGVDAGVANVMADGETHAATSGGSPHAHAPVVNPDAALPSGYGDNQIYIMARDPRWLYSYWEIQRQQEQTALEMLGGSWDRVSTILRVYDVSEGIQSFDVSLPPGSRSWYINVAPNRSYYVEIGLLHRDGRFVALARSNTVVTPRAGMSEVIDEQWMGIDFETMYALSGGLEVGKSSAELQRVMEQRLQSAITSGSGAGAVSSMASPVKPPKERGFWFVLDCELIVYGATEPDAKVTLQGKDVTLRPDGTFSFRFNLPDGSYHLDATAESADGLEKRTIIPIVTRTTQTPEPVIPG